jgi:hypothetical protein
MARFRTYNFAIEIIFRGECQADLANRIPVEYTNN